MTTVTLVQLVSGTLLGTSDALIYTPATQTTAQIGRAVFTNTSASAATLTVGITTGGALGTATIMISARSLAPGESYVSPELAGAVIPPNSQLRGFASASGAINCTLSGLTIV